MGKINLLKNTVAVVLLGSSFVASAQSSIHPNKFADNYYRNFVGTRFTVTAPASVQGEKLYTISNDGVTATGQWGGPVTGTITGNLVKAITDSSACSAITNTFNNATDIAVVYRGNCEFGVKAFAVQQKGAKACIIVNNVGGAPVGMGAGASGGSVNIPVFMISKDDGDAIVAELNAGHTVTMNISSTWGYGNANDLAILLNGTALWHSYAIPANQLTSDNNHPAAYKNHDGAFIANFGTAPQTNVKLKSTFSFTPTGEATSILRSDSITVPSFTVADSILAVLMDNNYDVNAAKKGRFDMKYELSADNADDFPGDNKASYSFYTTDNIYSKGRYDFTKGVPYAGSYRKLITATNAPDYTWGPMYYVAKGGYGAKTTQFSLAKDDATTSNALSGTMLIYLFKWTDGVSATGDPIPAADSLVEYGELQLLGTATKEFKDANDTSSGIFEVPFFNITTNAIGEIPLEANSWYWVAAETPSDYFLGVDGIQNYYPRSFINAHKGEFAESYAPVVDGTVGDPIQDPTKSNFLISPYPFERPYADSVRYSNQAEGLVPAIPLITGLFPTSVQHVTNAKPMAKMEIYPNPVVNQLNVSVGFEKATAVVTYDVIDAVGRHVAREVHNNVINDTYTLSTDKLAAGIYYVSVVANNSVMTRKFVVTK